MSESQRDSDASERHERLKAIINRYKDLSLLEMGAIGMVHVRPYTRVIDGRPMSVSEHYRRGPFPPVPNPRLRNDASGLGGYLASRENGRTHKGVDILAAPGTVVQSPVSGNVTIGSAYKDEKKFGGEFMAVKVKDEHGNIHVLRYVSPVDSHGRVVVKRDDYVVAGEAIGVVQNRAAKDSSKKMKNHVHYEIIGKDKKHKDPTPHLQRWQKGG